MTMVYSLIFVVVHIKLCTLSITHDLVVAYNHMDGLLNET